MSKPITPTPIITGKSAELFLKDFDRTNKLMENPKYRSRQLKRLAHCEKIYLDFMSRFKKGDKIKLGKKKGGCK